MDREITVPKNDSRNLFVVWNPFQRRAQSLGRMLDLNIRYYHYRWEEKGKLFKALFYVPKIIMTLLDLFRFRPSFIFIQLAPTPLLYVAAFYCAIKKSQYVSDCHNTMIYDDHWIKWPFAKRLLYRSFILLVHNEDVRNRAEAIGLQPFVLRDPLPFISVPQDIDEIAGINIKEKTYVIVPCGMAVDEPVKELFMAARLVPEVLFVLTWFADKLHPNMRAEAPANIRFTGFLDETYFNALYANANAALVLTTREGTQPSGASEAIALGVPLVVSNIDTTRRLYQDAPIFVKNEPDSIAKGVKVGLAKYHELGERITDLKKNLRKDVEVEISALKKLMQRNY